MIRLLRALAIGAALCLGASAPAGADGAPADARAMPAVANAEATQVLVMLRLPPEHFRPNVSYGGSYGSAGGMAARRRIADRLAHQHGLTVVTSWPMPILGVDCYVMSVQQGQTTTEVAAELSRDPQVAWSEPMQLYRGQSEAAAPNDPLYPLQPAAKTWRLADLHRIATGRNVRVAVVDSRVDAHHPDLASQILVSRDFLPDHPGEAETHGTAVAGIIAASADNQMGVAGVAPQARLMALRACWQGVAQETLCDTLSLARALSYAIENKAQVINLSLSGPPALLLERLVDAAKARGALVVGAVDPKVAQGGFPASYAGVIAVASDGTVGGRGVYFAPGRDIPTTQPHAKWSLVNGSSFAAAHVTGLLALVREKDPHAMDPVHIVVARGGREIDACATLVRASGPCADCTCPSLPGPPAVGGH